MTTSFVTAAEAARQIGCRPRDISDAFYQRRLDDSGFPLVGGRRLIPLSQIDAVRKAIQRNGRQAKARP